ANDACLQTIPRTVNTGLGALFILVALYLLGGETLTDFALALLIGILVGTYSSLFTAAPLAVAIEGRTSAEAGTVERRVLAPSGGRAGPQPAPVRSDAAHDELAAVGAPPPSSPRPRSTSPAPRPRKRKAKNRGRRR
ncbi:MAG: hypothetical protein M3N68_13250, partial [Actinomycetota bacterium]|nr:hypothetical protein [Actinomycetota bacterium]